MPTRPTPRRREETDAKEIRRLLDGSHGRREVGDDITKAPPGSQTFNASGSFTVPPGITSIIVDGVGGGGGGRFDASFSQFGGGGAGGCKGCTFTVVSGSIIPITIGAGGPQGNLSGTNGGNTVIGVLLTLQGGRGGAGTGGVGGSAGAVAGGAAFANGNTAAFNGGTLYSGAGGGDAVHNGGNVTGFFNGGPSHVGSLQTGGGGASRYGKGGGSMNPPDVGPGAGGAGTETAPFYGNGATGFVTISWL